jgi:hypothetical protein
MNGRFAEMGLHAIGNDNPTAQVNEARWVALADRLNDQIVALREKVAYLEGALNKARIERDLLMQIVAGRK